MAKLDHKASHYFNFLLTHEVGFTIQLVEEVVGHAVGGESLPGIGHRLADRYTSRLRKLLNQPSKSLPQVGFDIPHAPISIPHPFNL